MDSEQPDWLKAHRQKAGNPNWYPGMPSPHKEGRPKGVPDRRNQMRKELMRDAPEVLQVVIDAAKGGDVQAANILLQRCLPTIKSQAERVKFELDPDAPLTEQAKQIISAIAAGEVDPDTGKSLLECLSTLNGIIQIDELAARITELEAGRQS